MNPDVIMGLMILFEACLILTVAGWVMVHFIPDGEASNNFNWGVKLTPRQLMVGLHFQKRRLEIYPLPCVTIFLFLW